MQAESYPGTCVSCSQSFPKEAMAEHLKSCPQRKAQVEKEVAKQGHIFHLTVQGAGTPEYWIEVETDESTTFRKLDRFLRDIWLECCGHTSAFRSRAGEIGMGVKLGSVLRRGMKLDYEYDFGSTTELELKVVGERQGQMEGKSVRTVARNDPPKIACGACHEAVAEHVCANGCGNDSRGWLCDACAKKHKCGEDMLLPVVNSPRVGVCGYTG